MRGFRVGLGYRRALHAALVEAPPGAVDFVELAPENYLGMGGEGRRRLESIRAKYPVLTHGFALSLGGEAPLDPELLEGLATFTASVQTPWHSDHLCWSSVDGTHLHELLPLVMTPATAKHTARRVREAGRALPVPLAVENVSAYARHTADTLTEAEFVHRVVHEADCGLLLDVNNVLVNSLNFGGDPRAVLDALPLERVVQIHVAGYTRESPELVIDTHGAAVDEAVWPLLAHALARTGAVPVLLERDHHFPPMPELLREIDHIRAVGRAVLGRDAQGPTPGDADA
jgi:uncharacterized protein (UPF0276 family)